MLYPVAIFQTNNKLTAVVPDLPTLEISGSVMADVISAVRLAIIEQLRQLVSDNQPIPIGQDIGVYLSDTRYLGAVWAIINLESLAVSEKLHSVTLSLPESLLTAIYQQIGVDASHTQLEGFIVDAVLHRVNQS